MTPDGHIAHPLDIAAIREPFLLSKLPEEFLNTYIGARLYLESAITSWALHNTGAMSWSMMKKPSDA